MNREQLEHIIRAAAGTVNVRDIVVTTRSKPRMYMRGSIALLLLMLCGATTAPSGWIGDVRTFVYLTQNLEKDDTIRKLAASPYELLIIDTFSNQHGGESADMKSIVASLRSARAGRHVLCYMDIGQAEDYRSYWDKSWFDGWKAATASRKGKPDFILTVDPAGWSGNYPVAFWDPRWKAILLGPTGMVRKVMGEGYDGLLLDWVQGYREAAVVAEAKRQGVDPVKAMVDLLAAVRADARAVNPDAVIVPLNVPYLIDDDSHALDLIDAVAFEGTWFNGKANADWDDGAGGDIAATNTDVRLKQYAKYQAAGKPVFTIDYCLDAAHAKQVYDDAGKRKFVPLVTRVAVEHLTGTPPGLAR